MTQQITNPFQFDLVSPEGIVVSEDVGMVVIPGQTGEIGVLANHAPLLSSLQPGVLRTVRVDGTEDMFFVTGGVADINGNLCTVLAEEAVNLNKLDADEIREAVEKLREEQENHIGMEEEHYIQRQIEIMVAKLDAIHAYDMT